MLVIVQNYIFIAPTDHYSLGNRSHVYQKQGQYDKALKDAEAAIGFRKDWPKGYFRKGLSLIGMGRHEEAFKTFYECLTIEMVCGAVDTKSTSPSLMECAKELYCVIEQNVQSRMYQKMASLQPKLGQISSTPCLFTIGCSSTPTAVQQEKASNRLFHSHMNLSSQPSNAFGIWRDENDSFDSDSDRFTYSSEDPLSEDHVTRTLASNVHEYIPGLLKGMVEFVRTLYENSDKLDGVRKPKEDWYVRGLLSYRAPYRPIDPKAVDASDYECPLCMRLLWQPITTPCGHTFCRVCLDRALDHNSVCPLCKSAEVKKVYLVERREFVPNEFIESSMRRLLPIEYQERKIMQQVEISDFGGGTENANVIPIFVCTVSLPRIPCPLHVFEPRYRLMVRRAMESGTREFGMSCKIGDGP